MKRDYQLEINSRVEFIKNLLVEANASGIVFGNSGGKDSCLAGYLCKQACDNTVGIIMPCGNNPDDAAHARAVAQCFGIKSIEIDLLSTKTEFERVLKNGGFSGLAFFNTAPRLRMAALYAYAAENNMLVCGTGNRSESYVGYFTKYGDGGCDFNAISDLTVREIYELLHFVNAPDSILKKAPSAGLYQGQTDEKELGFAYDALDAYLLEGVGEKGLVEKFESLHKKTAHKRALPRVYK